MHEKRQVGDAPGTVIGAAVQAAPVFLDRAASIDKACELIREAGRNGADLIVFPEGFVPAHPGWFHFLPVSSAKAREFNLRLARAALDVPGPEVDQVARAARDAGAYVVLGACERSEVSPGSLVNSQLFFGPDGTYLGKHQKLTPTVGERIVHWGGWGDTLGTIDTALGPVSGLVCSENSNPLAMFALAAEQTRVHAMSWPPHMMAGVDLADMVLLTSRQFALVAKAFVISACGIVGEDYLEALEVPESETRFLHAAGAQGGSVIVGPDTRVIAGPLEGGEAILYGEMDLQRCAQLKITQDYAGHYNRPDVFSLRIDRSTGSYVTEHHSRGDDDRGPETGVDGSLGVIGQEPPAPDAREPDVVAPSGHAE